MLASFRQAMRHLSLKFGIITVKNMNNLFAVQNLKMALKKQTFYNILKAFSSDTRLTH